MAEEPAGPRPPLRGRPALLLATLGGCGLLRPAPGTWGSIAAILPVPLIALAADGWLLQVIFLLMAATAFGLGMACWLPAAEHFGRADPGEVVIDEAAGLWLGCACLPGDGLHAYPVVGALLMLASFRLCDVAKPGPVGTVDGLHGAVGVMADDCVAGVLASCAVLPFLF